MSIQVDTDGWVKGKNYPSWMDEIVVSMISKGYLLPDEDVLPSYSLVSVTAVTVIGRFVISAVVLGCETV